MNDILTKSNIIENVKVYSFYLKTIVAFVKYINLGMGAHRNVFRGQDIIGNYYSNLYTKNMPIT